MRTPYPKLDILTALAEFDIWLTASLGEIRDTERFQTELDIVSKLFEDLGALNGQFSSEGSCDPETLADSFLYLIEHLPAAESSMLLQALATVLFLVTGKSDNNSKCQLPIYLKEQGWTGLPKRQGKKAIAEIAIPRVLKAGVYMNMVSKLSGEPEIQRRMLEGFIGFLLSDKQYVVQLWSIGQSYFALKPYNRERQLLTPLVIFQVRGSVSASGGHGPEAILRERLVEWGLQPDIDFNLQDVVPTPQGGIVAEEDPNAEPQKKRGFDFVLPYRTLDWSPTIFIQSQFYAGDSGSVSHKVVDQTRASRDSLARIIPSARFIEYVDGAGYFASLNGDLRKLLSMPSTVSFFQIRSAPIRLRRDLQEIGYLLPMEVEHAILRTDGSIQAVSDLLITEGYLRSEIDRILQDCSRYGHVETGENDFLMIRTDRRTLIRRYFLLDVAAVYGSASEDGKPVGSFLVPGYGPFYGIRLDELARNALALAPALNQDWSHPTVLLDDIAWLCEQGWAMSR